MHIYVNVCEQTTNIKLLLLHSNTIYIAFNYVQKNDWM